MGKRRLGDYCPIFLLPSFLYIITTTVVPREERNINVIYQNYKKVVCIDVHEEGVGKGRKSFSFLLWFIKG